MDSRSGITYVSFLRRSCDLESIICPQCGSSDIWRDGHRDPPYRHLQRYRCKACGRRFSDSDLDLSHRQCSNSTPQGTLTRITKENAKMSTVTEQLNTKSVTVISRQTDRIIIEYTNHLLKKAQAHSTILGKVKLLKTLIERGADLNNPENVKLLIAKQDTWSNGRKRNAVYAYNDYVEMTGLTWEIPTYERVSKPIWIPTEKEIDQLIAACSQKIATFLQLLKETGMRPGEAYRGFGLTHKIRFRMSLPL